MNEFHRLLADRTAKTPIGTWVMSASPIVAEAVGTAGFDWGVLDMEHTPLDLMGLVHLLQAVGNTPMVPVVRVPWNDTVTVKRVLDAGAQTLLFPFVQDRDEAARAVAATRYPPDGVRGMAGMSRASRFGTTPDFLRGANRTIGVVVQLETPQAIERLEQIAAVPGVDALFVGPGDLSGSMGHVGNTVHPDVMAAMAAAARRAHAIGKPVGTVGGTAEVVARYREIGYDYVAIASDLGLLMRAAQGAVQALRATPAGARIEGSY
ncbi:MAG: 2-dehydro-3-deoxyglucarate aldolase [Betaproteobacteria bacterium]|nr:2-dehydro-3-deoxyglucarate aldolase [Betaproteobacteria bacterium]